MKAHGRRLGRRLAVLGVAAALTAALAQTTTTAAIVAQAGNGGNAIGTAATFCAAPGGTTLSVTDDTYVDASDPDTTKGGSTELVVRSGTTAAHVLLRFTLPTPGKHCRLTDATLRLNASASQGPGTIDVHRASATWSSAGRPGPTGTAVGAASGAPGWHTWDVTTLVSELYAGPDHGFLLKDRDETVGTRATSYESLNSPNTANRPQLVLTWG